MIPRLMIYAIPLLLLLCALISNNSQLVGADITQDEADLPEHCSRLKLCGRCETCNQTTSTCDPTGDLGCPCQEDDFCQEVTPNSNCDSLNDTCQCAEGFHFNLTGCVSDTEPCGPEPDRNCSMCFYCDVATDTCLPDFGCRCYDNAECSAKDTNMECGFLGLCECAVGFSFDVQDRTCKTSCTHFGCHCDDTSECQKSDSHLECGEISGICECERDYHYIHDKKECRLVCNQMSAGAIAGIVCGVILENALVVVVTALVARRRRRRKQEQ